MIPLCSSAVRARRCRLTMFTPSIVDAARLREDADDLAFLALVVAAHDAHRVALGDVQLDALGVVGVPLPVDRARRGRSCGI